MSYTLDLNNASNWSLVYSNNIPPTVVSTAGSTNIYATISTIKPAVLLHNPILAVEVSTAVPAGKRWRYAGRIAAFSSSEFGDIYTQYGKPLFLGKFNLAVFDEILNDYQLEIDVPGWFTSANISIYEYIGSIS